MRRIDPWIVLAAVLASAASFLMGLVLMFVILKLVVG